MAEEHRSQLAEEATSTVPSCLFAGLELPASER